MDLSFDSKNELLQLPTGETPDIPELIERLRAEMVMNPLDERPERELAEERWQQTLAKLAESPDESVLANPFRPGAAWSAVIGDSIEERARAVVAAKFIDYISAGIGR
jgi:hypothetical protein